MCISYCDFCLLLLVSLQFLELVCTKISQTSSQLLVKLQDVPTQLQSNYLNKSVYFQPNHIFKSQGHFFHAGQAGHRDAMYHSRQDLVRVMDMSSVTLLDKPLQYRDTVCCERYVHGVVLGSLQRCLKQPCLCWYTNLNA